MTRTWSDRVALTLLILLLAGWAGSFWVPLAPLHDVRLTLMEQPRLNAPLLVQIDYCKSRDLTPDEVRWALLDGVQIVLPPTPMILPIGCHTERVLLPPTAHMIPGRYVLEMLAVYPVLPWRHVLVHAKSEMFEVLP